jgi:IS5 family transposase
MDETFYDTLLCREFTGLQEFDRVPDESTILSSRHMLADAILIKANELLSHRGPLLRAGTAAHATLIAAPSSIKNKDKERDPEMHSSKKVQQMYFGMKAHIGADSEL